jgi:hypothetical protein
MPKKPNRYPYNDTDDHWVSTAQSSFQRTMPPSPQTKMSSPPARYGRDGQHPVASVRSPQQQSNRDELYAAWASATSPQAAAVSRSWEGVYSARPLPEHDPRVDWQPMGTYSTGGVAGVTSVTSPSPFLATSQHRARTPPPGAYQRGSFVTSTEKPSRIGRKPVASRCTDDHIVFENTRYEDSADPLFYAKNRRETDGPGPHAHTLMQVPTHYHHQHNARGVDANGRPYDSSERYPQQFHSPRYQSEEDDEGEDDGTDWQRMVEQYGFPGKRHTVARRRLCSGQGQERTMNLFSREVDPKSPIRGEGPRRHLLSQPQSMSNAFQAAGEEVPFFRGGKRVAVQDHQLFDHTQRVLRTELQEDSGPFRAHVRVGGMQPQDELSRTLQGSATPQRETRRQFFDFRR